MVQQNVECMLKQMLNSLNGPNKVLTHEFPAEHNSSSKKMAKKKIKPTTSTNYQINFIVHIQDVLTRLSNGWRVKAVPLISTLFSPSFQQTVLRLTSGFLINKNIGTLSSHDDVVNEKSENNSF